MSDQSGAPPSPTSGLQVVTAGSRSAEFKDIYSNVSRVSVSPWDFSVTFSLTKELIPNMPPVVEDQAVVRMSPSQFKTFTQSLLNTMTAWEEVFGTISMNNALFPQEKIKAIIVAMRETAFKQP
jgi:hypothetical protein